MGMHKKAIDILNANVYGTNLLLIPGLIFTIYILLELNNWKNDDTIDGKKLINYSLIWYFLLILFSLTIIFSTIYHYSMFGKNNFLIKIGSIDYRITAPLLFTILVIMNVYYIKFLNSDCDLNSEKCNEKYSYIYYLSLIISIIGTIIFLIKILLYRGYSRKSFIFKVKYIAGHTFFHYVAYTGISFILMLYYIENRNIFDLFFTDKCKDE